ncbi:UNVERIFIED_CONTAM: LINE-1 retrotransposable element O protein [Sesamum radiatum]|uniref:LINE-1 retrotransposable element O protein n=1 Tax=Sesamum radiatum TaxID=300843 RepID=A0AAW2JSJ9_SESRA
MLCVLPTKDEIKQAIFDMCPDSAVGPDGFSALFYQVTWDIIAQDVTAAVQDFFCGTPLPKSFKATSIALIPKVPNPSSWTDFCPISLCNVSNKIYSKIMNDRLSMILPGIIALSQSGFVGGRLISDNILLAQELIHSIGDKKRYDNVVFKLDMAKAYDRVQWRFFVLINGDKAGFFQSSQGLRQGDPISPSLFIIVAEFLARGLDRLFQQNPALGYCNKGGMDINHLSYADDIIIFLNASRRSIRKLVDFLGDYQKISRQQINCNKSSFIVSNRCPSLIHQRIHKMTSFSFKPLPVTYLGSPLYKGNKKCILYDNLIAKMRLKLQGWGQSSLSHGGRLALIKSTLCSMPLHLIQVLNPPKTVLHSIEQIMARFFWGSTKNHKKIHWTAWKRICQPVKEDWVSEDSLIWWLRSLTNFGGDLEAGVHYGQGQVSFWCDNWLGEQPLSQLVNLHSLAQKKCVITGLGSLLGECFKTGYQLISVFSVKASNWLPNVNAVNKLKRRNISFFLVKKTNWFGDILLICSTSKSPKQPIYVTWFKHGSSLQLLTMPPTFARSSYTDSLVYLDREK